MSLTISEFHAHVYFTVDTRDHAEELFNQIATALPEVDRGTFHTRTVGPHPSWMFTMSFNRSIFQPVTLWLMEHLDGLSALVHPLSGDVSQDANARRTLRTRSKSAIGCNPFVAKVKDHNPPGYPMLLKL